MKIKKRLSFNTVAKSTWSQEIKEEQIEELKKYYGFDKPVFTSYILSN